MLLWRKNVTNLED